MMQYGPCIGLSRSERWARAEKLGLDPPENVTLATGIANNLSYMGCVGERTARGLGRGRIEKRKARSLHMGGSSVVNDPTMT